MTIGVIRTIAVSVFRESVRDKILYNLVFFAVMMIAVSYLLSQLTAGQDIKVIKDLGLAAMSLFGLFIAVFIGIGLVSKEVEKRSIYALLSKPIRRHEFVVGKYLGLLLTLFVNLAIMAIAYYGVLAAVAWMDGAWMRPHWEAPAVDPALLKAIAMIFLQLAIVVAIALFFSTFSSPMLAAALTLGLYVVGHFNADLKNFEAVVDSKAVAYVARGLYYLLPNLAPLDVKSDVVHAVHVPTTYLLLNAAYSIVYASALVSAAALIFFAAGLQMTARRPGGVFIVALIGMLALAIALQVVRDRAFAHTAVDKQVLYVSDAEVMRRAALSYDTLLADVYWIRALQHYGGERQKPPGERRYALLYPLLDMATTLDSRFTIGYRFGAIFLAEPHPGGAGRPDLAIALLKKGVAFNPNKSEYYHDIGFIYYWNLHDYTTAAEWFSRGGDLPGAPFWLKTYAAVMLTRGGDREASRVMWTQIGQNEENDWLRRTAQLRLAQLDALDEIDVLDRIVTDYRKRTGRVAQSWELLAAEGVVPGIPTDPAGTPYTFDADTGKIGVSRDSELWPLPTEPAAAPELKRETLPVPR